MKPNTDQPAVAEQILESVKRQRESTERFAEPVTTTLPACLCGLDTNPVASPRMDIHCPKHDAPEAGGEPEYPERIWLKHTHQEPGWNFGYYVDKPQDDAFVEYARISRPAGEPSDEEFNPWYENYEKALVAEVLSTTPVDELNYDAAFRATDLTTAVASYQDCSGSATPLEPNRGWDDAEQGLMPTPVDEETVLRMISDSLSLDSLEILPARELKVLQDRITTALAEARRAGTPTTDARHPEDYCHRCNGPNISWFAPSLLWNQCVRAKGEPEIICPICFAELAKEANVTWSMVPDTVTSDYDERLAVRAAQRIINATIHSEEEAAVIVRDALVQSAAALAGQATSPSDEVKQQTCTWTLDIKKHENAVWNADCGKSTYFNESLHPQIMKFCPFCGKPLVEATKENANE